mgnify:CR=1 FL=1
MLSLLLMYHDKNQELLIIELKNEVLDLDLELKNETRPAH